jgi:hypothetical protein
VDSIIRKASKKRSIFNGECEEKLMEKWHITWRLSFLIAVLAIVVVAGQPARAAGWYVVETMTDACDEDVTIKVPYSYEPYFTLDAGDVLLLRSSYFKYNLKQYGGPYSGVIVNPATGYSAWTTKILPVPKNGDGYIRWYCGVTAERSRCPSNTGAISARLGPDDLLETRCLKYG